jgi:hypothetical protein
MVPIVKTAIIQNNFSDQAFSWTGGLFFISMRGIISNFFNMRIAQTLSYHKIFIFFAENFSHQVATITWESNNDKFLKFKTAIIC